MLKSTVLRIGRGICGSRSLEGAWSRIPGQSRQACRPERADIPVHDRGRVLADLAVMIADGGRVMSDLAVLRDQSELFGPVASDPTLWRTLEGVGDLQRDKLAAARARTRRHVWDQIVARYGAIPASVVADRDLGTTIVVRLDATLVVAHSDGKELASGGGGRIRRHRVVRGAPRGEVRTGSTGSQHRHRPPRGPDRGDRPDPRVLPP